MNLFPDGVHRERLVRPRFPWKFSGADTVIMHAQSGCETLGPAFSTRSFPICRTCGTQFPPQHAARPGCVNCTDGNPDGRQWTSLEELRAIHRNVFRLQEPGLWGVGTEPDFALGQRALLVQTQKGNVLWDCTPLIDEATIDAVTKLGGVAAIAISHPHYHSSMIEWSRTFGDAPIYLPASHRPCVVRPDPAIHFWEGETLSLGADVTLIRTGGHFDGSQVLHWADGADGRGALLSGDLPHVVSDRRWMSIMASYPNFISLKPEAMRRIAGALEPYSYGRIYGARWPAIVTTDGGDALRRPAGGDEAATAAGGPLWDRMLTAPRTWPDYIRYF